MLFVIKEDSFWKHVYLLFNALHKVHIKILQPEAIHEIPKHTLKVFFFLIYFVAPNESLVISLFSVPDVRSFY